MSPVEVLYFPLAYLIGAIPTGYLWAKHVRGVDIRTLGSGNIGATNLLRTFGWKPGALVLLVDVAKGALVAGPLAVLLGLPQGGWLSAIGGLVAVLGHNYTVFLGFKGGKGVATSCGVLLVLTPLSMLAALAIFAGSVAATRMVSVGSLASALALPFCLVMFGEGRTPLVSLSVLLAVLVWVKHVANIRRILAGSENKVAFGRKGRADGAGPPEILADQDNRGARP